MKKPTLSLCVISGDAHVNLLPRLFESFVVRPGGPACDEIVLGFNGERTDLLFPALGIDHVLDREFKAVGKTRTLWRGTPLLIHRQKWVGNFSLTRQENFEQASGEWRMYADADDVLAAKGDPQVVESISAPTDGVAGTVSFVGTLQERLRRLPEHVNCLFAPYNYLVSEKGKALVRSRRPRIVRWDEYWAWAEPVHEALKHVLDRVSAVYDGGVLLIHKPILSVEERSERNFEITKKRVADLEESKQPLPASLLHDWACELMDRGQYEEASTRFQSAAACIVDHESKLLYLGLAARCELRLEKYDNARSLATSCIEANPLRPEGYLIAAEVAYAMQMYDYCVKWYEAGGTKPLPAGVMAENRFDLNLRPAHTVGVAYLRMGRCEEALAVADKALLEANDAYARLLRTVALEGKKRVAYVQSVNDIITNLLTSGFVGVAHRTLDQVSPTLKYHETIPMRERIFEAAQKPVVPIPSNSAVQKWFTGADPAAVKVLVPVDAAQSPAEMIRAVCEQAAYKQRVLLVATDTGDLTGYSAKARHDAVTAPALLAECEKHGEVEGLSLVEDVGTDGEVTNFVAAEIVKGRRPGWRPDFTLWCPVMAETWGPWRINRRGMGGSEESVVFFAQELARRGARVQVYAPLDQNMHRGVHVEGGVRWHPLEALDTTRALPGIAISCRAPKAVRVPCFTPKNLYVWHQDAFYQQGWTPAIAKAARGMFVSKWQRAYLLNKLLNLRIEDPEATVDSWGVVCGDGIPESVLDWTSPEVAVRDPLACVYASSPMRGLEQLLDVWPKILEAQPGASLHLYYGWETAPTAYQAVRELREKVMGKVKQPGIVWHGRVSQIELEKEMKIKGVFLYNCQFPEGFCIAGVRAAAAGLLPVYRKIAALPEIQYPSQFAVSDALWHEGGSEEFTQAAIAALDRSQDQDAQELRVVQREWAQKHVWGRVVETFLADVESHHAGTKREIA